MESVSKIRRWVLVEERSIRSVARAPGLSRNTIKKYLKDESPPSYQRQAPPVRHKLCNGFDFRLRELFDQDMKRPRRERRTAQKLYEQLVFEGYTGSYSPVQRFVRDLKRAGAGSGEAFIRLHFAAGDALQFDWSEEQVVLGGVKQKIKVAHFRLCHSRKPFVVAYPGESQEMVLDAFAQALSFYGGVLRRVIIDNPKTMVTYVSRSKDRIFHPRFLALMNHYVMEPVACTPAAGWEKGQVENQVQFLRGRLFVPKPAFDDFDALNAWPAAQMADARDLECDPVYRGGGLPMGDAAQGFPALYDGSALFLPAARQRHARHHQRNAGHGRTPSGRPVGRADSGCDRQPKRENHGKRRAARL